MKRENEDNYQEQDQSMQSDENQQIEDGNGQDELQDDTNDTNNFNNLNQDNGNGGPNPPKRLRRTDEEEIRLLIPSKVDSLLAAPLIHSQSFHSLLDGGGNHRQRRPQHPEIAH
jgi:hypothetical protein